LQAFAVTTLQNDVVIVAEAPKFDWCGSFSYVVSAEYLFHVITSMAHQRSALLPTFLFSVKDSLSHVS